MELHDHLHLRDTHRDDDLFVNLLWSASRAFFGPFNHAHTFWYLDVLMLLRLRDTFWYVDSINLWTWMTRITHLVMDDWVSSDFFRPTTHLMPYWGIFPFRLRFVDLHWFAWSSTFMRYMSSWWFVFILRWFLSGVFLESFSQAHTFWYCHDSLKELSQAHRLPYHHFSEAHVISLIHPH